MYQLLRYLDADTALLKRTDFDSFCQGIFVHLARRDPICGQTFPLFDRKSTAHQARFLGYTAISCSGSGPVADTRAALEMCSVPCTEDTSQPCCWVPSSVSQLFSCCRSLGCCVEQSSGSSAPCEDKRATCPKLKKQIDAAGKSCYTDDLGALTNISAYAGMHLADQCCPGLKLVGLKNKQKRLIHNTRGALCESFSGVGRRSLSPCFRTQMLSLVLRCALPRMYEAWVGDSIAVFHPSRNRLQVRGQARRFQTARPSGECTGRGPPSEWPRGFAAANE